MAEYSKNDVSAAQEMAKLVMEQVDRASLSMRRNFEGGPAVVPQRMFISLPESEIVTADVAASMERLTSQYGLAGRMACMKVAGRLVPIDLLPDWPWSFPWVLEFYQQQIDRRVLCRYRRASCVPWSAPLRAGASGQSCERVRVAPRAPLPYSARLS